MMRLFQRALKRSGLPIAYSQGYNPHMKMSLAVPLSVGMTSSAEYLELQLETPGRALDVQQRLQQELPPGLTIMETRLSPYKGSIAALVALVEYSVTLQGMKDTEAILRQKIDRFNSAQHVPFQKTNKSGTREIDIRSFVRKLEMIAFKDDHCILTVQILMSPQGSIKPEDIMISLGTAFQTMNVHRCEMMLRSNTGKYFSP